MSRYRRNTTHHWKFQDYCPHCRATKYFRVAENEGVPALGRCPTCTRLVDVTDAHRARAVQSFDFG